MQSAGILLIDDDRRLAEMVGRYLGQAGFSVQVQGTARAGLEALVERTPDLILLDLMLPDGDGLDVCRQIRQRGGLAARVPILMLTARGETTDRVVGLELEMALAQGLVLALALALDVAGALELALEQDKEKVSLTHLTGSVPFQRQEGLHCL